MRHQAPPLVFPWNALPFPSVLLIITDTIWYVVIAFNVLEILPFPVCKNPQFNDDDASITRSIRLLIVPYKDLLYILFTVV